MFLQKHILQTKLRTVRGGGCSHVVLLIKLFAVFFKAFLFCK
jgi:hypothetical protein